MIKVTINGKKEFTIEKNLMDGRDFPWDVIEFRENTFHVIKDNKGYNATLISFNRDEKTMVINVNGNDYEIAIRDQYDLLMQQLGIASKTSSAIQNVRAPMPGLIISISVQQGDEVNKGDTLLILEAMKMENVIKSPRNGKIKKVNVQLTAPVEKGEVMLEFE